MIFLMLYLKLNIHGVFHSYPCALMPLMIIPNTIVFMIVLRKQKASPFLSNPLIKGSKVVPERSDGATLKRASRKSLTCASTARFFYARQFHFHFSFLCSRVWPPKRAPKLTLPIFIFDFFSNFLYNICIRGGYVE